MGQTSCYTNFFLLCRSADFFRSGFTGSVLEFPSIKNTRNLEFTLLCTLFIIIYVAHT